MDKSALALIYSRKKLPCDQPPSVTQPSSTKSGEEFIQVEHTIPKERLGEWNENFYQLSRFQPGGRKRAARGALGSRTWCPCQLKKPFEGRNKGITIAGTGEKSISPANNDSFT